MPQPFVSDSMEFQINSSMLGDQYQPTMASLPDGRYIIAWVAYDQDGSGDGVFAQLFDGNGHPLGSAFQVNSTASGDQYAPAITSLSDGGYLVTWTSSGQDGSGDGIFAQRFSASGTPLGPEFCANATTAGDQFGAFTAQLGSGGYLIVWSDWGRDGDGEGLYAQRFDNAGLRVGSEFLVNTTTASDQYSPAITSLADGGVVVTWTSWDQDGDSGGIFAQRYDGSGVPLGGEFLVSQTSASDQYSPAIAGLAGGGFVVTWTAWDQDGSGEGIYARTFGTDGEPTGPEFLVNTVTADDQYLPTVAATANGGFVVSWTSNGEDGSGGGIFAQAFDSHGTPAGTVMQVNTTTAGTQFAPTMSQSGAGGFAVSWMAWGQIGSGWSIYGREFHPVQGSGPILTGPQADLVHAHEDSAYRVSGSELLTGFSDPSGGLLRVVGLTASNASITGNADGSYTILPLADYNGPIVLSYSVSNAQGTMLAASLNLVVDAVNDGPSITDARAELPAVSEDASCIIAADDLLAGFSDVDGDVLFAAGVTADHGTVTDNGDGTFTIAPAAEFNGTMVVSYLVCDGNGGSASASLAYAIDAVNDAPALTGSPAALLNGVEDTGYVVSAATLLSGFTDPDGGPLSVLGLVADHGLVIDNANGTFTIMPDADYNGIMTLTYQVSDGLGGSVAAALNYVIDPVVDGPNGIVMIGGSVAEMSRNGTIVGSFVGHSVDGDRITYALTNSAGGRFTINSTTGVLSVANGASLDYEAASALTVTVQASHAAGPAFSQSFVIHLTNVVESQTRTLTSGSDNFMAPSDDNWTIDGLAGGDSIATGAGNDTIRGGSGNDTITSAGGNDTFTVRGTGDGFDAIAGGSGNDRIIALASGTTIGLSAITGIETISANGFSNVRIAGSSNSDLLDFSNISLVNVNGIDAGRGADTVMGSTGADTIRGNAGNDVLMAGSGDDVITFNGTGDGYDSIDGGIGADRILALSANTRIGLTQFTGIETISANGFANVRIQGSGAADRLDFSAVSLVNISSLDAGAGNDTVTGSSGNDTIVGRSGGDVLTGMAGNDIFDYNAASDSRVGSIDTITDFVHGLDRIDLGDIDANSRVSGNNAFAFISGEAFHRTAGELRAYFDPTVGQTVIQGDVNGDGRADLEIHLAGNVTLTQIDFIL